MKIHKEPPFLFTPLVLILTVILLIISSFAGYSILAFLFSAVLSLALFSKIYLNMQVKKISWKIKKYHDASSIDEFVTCQIEIRNDSALPMYRLKMNIESRSDRELVFTGGDEESSMISISLDPLLHHKKRSPSPSGGKAGEYTGGATWSF
jgi:uncharacterized protein (DUF58 family)